MKGAIVVCFLALAAATLARPEEAHYTDKYDHTNVKEIIDNERLLDAYIKCILDKGKCTAEGNELKSHIADALQTDCEKCTPVQRDQTKVVLTKLINDKPEAWTELKNKYDPSGIYSKKHEDEVKAIKN